MLPLPHDAIPATPTSCYPAGNHFGLAKDSAWSGRRGLVGYSY